MVILSGQLIYNKIEHGLFNILGDIVIEKHVRLRKTEMIISSGEFIKSHESQGPMKMLERRAM